MSMGIDEEPILVLKSPERPGLVVFAVACGVSIGVGFFMALLPVGNFLGWLTLGFAGVAGLCGAAYLLPANSTLILGVEGFTVRFASRAMFYSWSEVDHFAVAGRHMVAFRLLDGSEHASPTEREMTGYDGALPCGYGSLSPEALADQLNECRQQLGTAAVDRGA
jgi:hypothetical protein